MTEAYVALSVHNDAVAARAAAFDALEIARGLDDVDHEMLARATEGLALVADGHVVDGMRRLSGAAIAALGGEMADLKAISITCCYVIQACERVRDFERAAEWCVRFREFCEQWRLGHFLTFCRIQYGAVLLWRGDWPAAEAELLAAAKELEAVRPAARAAALVRLGDLRRRQGRWEEAAALLEATRTHRLAALRRAALALDQNDPVAAEELAAQAVRRGTGSKDAERAAALELLVRARVALGALEAAATALAELEQLADSIDTESVRATALFGAASLARANAQDEDARRLLQDSIHLFEAGSAPFEAAGARVELARALLAASRSDAARAQAQEALQTFEHLGAARHADVARALLDERRRPRLNGTMDTEHQV